MSLYRALFCLLIITSLIAGPAVGLHASDKKEDKQSEKQDKEKKDSSMDDSKEGRKKKHDDKKDRKGHKDRDHKDHDHKDKKKESPKKDKSESSDKKKSTKDDQKSKEGKKDDQSDKKPKKDAPKKEMKPEPKKEEKKKEETAPEKSKESKDKPVQDAPKKEMETQPKKEEPTPAKSPKPEEKKNTGQAKKMESKLEPKKEDKPEEIPAPKEEPKPQPKPQPKPDPKKIAFTDLDKVDDDFAYQGEYYGKLRLPGGILESTGIQVIARGDGNFVGRQLRGGLPGNGWRNGQLIDLSGKRDGNQLVLSQGGYEVVVTGNKATVVNSAGDTLGILTKVHRRSELLGLKPSSSATVLFDGKSADGFVGAKINDKGELQIGTITKDPVQDFRIHLEFRLPYMPYATGQSRSNSGLYIQERYEVQILDSFGLPGEFNECGALYRTKSPDLNMCFPPLAWQTYDVYFTAARFDDEGEKISPARITVQHNGILVQDNYLIPNKTGAGKPEGAEPRPIKLQDHGNPVVFRNVWIEYLGGPVATSQAETVETPAKK